MNVFPSDLFFGNGKMQKNFLSCAGRSVETVFAELICGKNLGQVTLMGRVHLADTTITSGDGC